MKKSFSQAVSNSFDIHLNQLPKPYLKGNELAIKISESEYQAGVQECKNILYGRVTLSKGDSPLKIDDLRVKLLKIWRPTSSWNVVSLGKGFYEFNFSSVDDQRRIPSHGSWNLNPGVLWLSSWTLDFNPGLIRQSCVQSWVRIHGLSREYRRPKILFEIGIGIGVPIALDEATMKRTFGHFARILIEVDLNADLHDKIMVEREGYAFFVDLEYERLPQFCSSCQVIGHSASNCRKNLQYDIVNKDHNQKDSRKQSMQYVPKSVKDPEIIAKKPPLSAADKGKQVVAESIPANDKVFNPTNLVIKMILLV